MSDGHYNKGEQWFSVNPTIHTEAVPAPPLGAQVDFAESHAILKQDTDSHLMLAAPLTAPQGILSYFFAPRVQSLGSSHITFSEGSITASMGQWYRDVKTDTWHELEMNMYLWLKSLGGYGGYTAERESWFGSNDRRTWFTKSYKLLPSRWQVVVSNFKRKT